MATPEAKVKHKITQALKDAKVWYFLPTAGRFGKAGVPDYVCCIDGMFLTIEAKANGGQPTGLQDQTMKEIREAGGACLVIDEHNVDSLPAKLESFSALHITHK